MTELLLDTQAVLLWTTDDPRLSTTATRLLEDPGTRCVVSAASVWELAIKHQSGKLPLPEGYFDSLLASDLELLAISERHALAAAALPVHHRDPFDRMLIAQARTEGLALVGSDAAFAAYDVEVIW